MGHNCNSKYLTVFAVGTLLHSITNQHILLEDCLAPGFLYCHKHIFISGYAPCEHSIIKSDLKILKLQFNTGPLFMSGPQRSGNNAIFPQ